MTRAAARLTAALAALTALVAVAPGGAAGRSRSVPRVVTAGGAARYARFQARPYQVVYSGDGAAFLAGRGSSRGHLRWSSWTAEAGRGSGADWRDDCTPDCADGHYHPYPATVTVTRPRTIAGRRLFTRMTITYLRGRPRDSRRHGATIVFSLRVSAGQYYWS